MATVASDAQGLDALLKCPFCGGEAEVLDNDKTWKALQCRACDFVIERYAPIQNAIAAWNRRTPPATLSPTLSAQSVATCEECRSAIDGDPYVIKVWESIGEKQYWHSRCFVLSHIALAHHRTSAQGEG